MKTYEQFCQANEINFFELSEREKRFRYANYLQGWHDGLEFQNNSQENEHFKILVLEALAENLNAIK